MPTYQVDFIYAKLTDDSMEVEAESPEEAERIALEELQELNENCYLERLHATWVDDVDIEPERPYIEVGEPTIEVEIDGLLTVVNKPRGVNLVITGMTPGLFDSDTRVVDSKFEKVPA